MANHVGLVIVVVLCIVIYSFFVDLLYLFILIQILDLVGAFNAAMMMKPMDDSMDEP